ncbi:MAG: hypothetical protein Q9182_004473 [Xanthomendoza sp. 2 TL-2023]
MHPLTIILTCFTALAAAAPRAENTNAALSSSGGPISLTTIISIAESPEKIERKQQSTALLLDYVRNVKDHEPDVLEFDVSFEHEKAKFVTYEVYKNEAAIEAHLQKSYVEELVKIVREEGLERAPSQVHFLEKVAGFEREGGCD